MQINNMDFIQEAENIYRKNPSKFGFAFWKFRELLKTAEVHKSIYNDCIHLYAIKDNKLIYYWSNDKANMVIPLDRLLSFDLLFIHADYINFVNNLKETHNIYDCNALIYNKSLIDSKEDNSDYYVDSFNFKNDNDFIQGANIINNSTSDAGNMTPDRIKNFTTLPVFDKDLWVLVKEVKTQIPVSIGICIYDRNIEETELEWIYVHKQHQKRNVGRMLINEIVKRSNKNSKTIRVGGIADEFYIKCGFNIKTDRWLWIPKKDKKVGWWD